MNGLEKILESIVAEAKAAAEEAMEKAHAEARQILEEARLKATQRGFELVSNAEVTAKEIVNRAKSQAELEQRKILLHAKCKIIDDSIKSVQNYILNLDAEKYFAFLLKLCKKYALPQKGEIVFSETDLCKLPNEFKDEVLKIAKSLGGELRISEKTVQIDGGFLLDYGDIVENCSIEALINENREIIEDHLNSLFFTNL